MHARGNGEVLATSGPVRHDSPSDRLPSAVAPQDGPAPHIEGGHLSVQVAREDEPVQGRPFLPLSSAAGAIFTVVHQSIALTKRASAWRE